MSYLQRARTLKPLDQALRGKEATTRVGLARVSAIGGRWDEGREHFRLAEEVSPDLRKEFTYLAKRSLFEAKASQRDESDRFLREAQAALSEPAPLWLALAIESTRFQMSAATIKGYAALWAADLKKKCQSQTAGEMASIMRAYLDAGVEYAGRTNHIEGLCVYLKRATRLKFRRADIEGVCEFLSKVDDLEATKLHEKLVKCGLKQHPDSVLLNFQAGVLAMTKSPPPFVPPEAIRHLEKALKLAEGATAPEDTAYLPEIRATLTLLKEMSERVSSLPRPGRGSSRRTRGFELFDDFDFDALDAAQWDDEEMSDDLFEADPRPKPRKQKKPKKR
jgi:hypothetical protein